MSVETTPPGDAAELENPQNLLRVLDRALDEHTAWLQAWHRQVICGGLKLPPELDKDGHLQTSFGKWLADHHDQGLLRQQAFRELTQEFTDMHVFANLLMTLVREGKDIPAVEYDVLLEKVEAFVGRLRRMQDAFRKAVSELDPLTGLHNRQVMLEELQSEYQRSLRTDTPCCIALTDIDHFKKVNDTHGHAAGDKVLATVAGRLLSQLRPYDLIYRYGGEEFLILLPNTDAATSISVLERLRKSLADRPIELESGDELPVTSSFGVCPVGEGVELKETVERADQALYQAKQTGRNRVCLWTASTGESE